MKKRLKRFFSALCASGIFLTALPLQGMTTLTTNMLTANAVYDLYAEFPDMECYVSHCIVNGYVEPNTGERSDFSFYQSFLNRRFAYNEIAEGVMNKTGTVILSQAYQLVTSLARDGISKLDDLSQKEIYELYIMDYLQYQYSSSAYENQYAENVIKYSDKAYRALVDYVVDMGKDEKYLKQLSDSSKKEIIAEADFLKDNVQPVLKIADEIQSVTGTLEEYVNQISTLMAITEANTERVEFLQGIRAQAVGNRSLCDAIDEVLLYIEDSVQSITVASIEKGIDTALDWAWGEISGALKKRFPELAAINASADILDSILNTSNQSANMIRIILLYTMEQYAIQATRAAFVAYQKDTSETKSKVFDHYFSSYLAYQAYASDWSKNFAAAGLLDGFLNNLKNCFSDKNKETYAYWEKKINNDISQCATAQKFINSCKKNYSAWGEEKATVDETQYSWRGHIYQVFDLEMSWTEARKYCEENGGHLASVTSQAEQEVIETMLSESGKAEIYWLGATDQDTENEWKWIDGEKFDYTFWAAHAPDDYKKVDPQGEDCLSILNADFDWEKPAYRFEWNDFCNELDLDNYDYGFICEWDNSVHIGINQAQEDDLSKTVCWNGHIYQLCNTDLSWSMAKSFCEQLGGHLATITSESEQKTIESLMSTGEKQDAYWLGATDIHSEGDWEWITGEQFSAYEKWSEGQPDNRSIIDENGENYLGILNKQMKWGEDTEIHYRFEWNDFTELEDYLFGFVCEWDTPEAQIMPIADTNEMRIDDHTYKIIYTDADEKEAKRIAESAGGHLVSVDSSNEQTIINLLTENAENTYYIIEWDHPVATLLGDVDLNGYVNKDDAILLQKYLMTDEVFTVMQGVAGDMNSDGRLTAVDLSLLKRAILKK